MSEICTYSNRLFFATKDTKGTKRITGPLFTISLASNMLLHSRNYPYSTWVKRGKMNIMLIDDDRECLESLVTALRLNGFDVQSFDSPDRAIHQYNPQTVDVVITDYHLPGINGTEILKEIRRKKAAAPVIIISGDPKKNIKNLSLQAGAYAFFRKPLNVKKIIAKIKRLPISR